MSRNRQNGEWQNHFFPIGAYEDLIEKYQFLKSVVSAVADPMIVIGTDMRVKLQNDAARSFSGLSFPPGKDLHCYQLLFGLQQPCDRMDRSCPLFDVIEKGKPVTIEYNREVDGEEQYFEILASPLMAENGTCRGIIETIRDITIRKKTELDLKKARAELEQRVTKRTTELQKSFDTLKAERDKFMSMLSALGQGMHILNQDYGIEYQNDILRQQFGDQIGKKCYEVYKQLDKPCEVCRMHKARESMKIQRTELLMSNGRHYAQSYAPFQDVDGDVKVLILLRDITDEKEHEAETLRAGQLAAIGELAAGVAHEINNPINGIINYAQLLLDESNFSTDSELLHRIIKEGERIADIVKNLLYFSRQGDDEIDEVTMDRVLKDSVALINHQLQKDGILLQEEYKENLPSVKANSQQLQQVFLNLLSNARHALNQRYPERDPMKMLEISTSVVQIKDKQYVRTTVTDRGTGIPKDIISNIFEPFFSTKNPGEGTGLGLSISHGLVKDFGGYLRVESNQHQYSKMIVDIPVCNENSPS